MIEDKLEVHKPELPHTSFAQNSTGKYMHKIKMKIFNNLSLNNLAPKNFYSISQLEILLLPIQ